MRRKGYGGGGEDTAKYIFPCHHFSWADGVGCDA